jgi:hypothetical protein
LCCVLTFVTARYVLDQGGTAPDAPREVARSGAPAVVPRSDEPVGPPAAQSIPLVNTPAPSPSATVTEVPPDGFVSYTLPQARPSAPAPTVVPPPTPPAPASPSHGSSSPNYFNPAYRPPVPEHYVQPHTRRDGTAVQGHYQTNPDDSFWNNYSSKGNVNPHTGQSGNRLPPTSTQRASPPSLNLQPLRFQPLDLSPSSRRPGSR